MSARRVAMLLLALVGMAPFATSIAQEAVSPGGATSLPQGGTAGLLGALAAILVWIGNRIWERWQTRASEKARDNLTTVTDVTAANTIARQEIRINSLEARIEALEAKLTTEQELRRNVQDASVALKMRVLHLEQLLMQHNVPIPPHEVTS